jgi:hypothetical protein
MNMKTRFTFAMILLGGLAGSAWALAPEERSFFGLTTLESTRPAINGQGYSFGICDTEFDVTHPALGWQHGTGYADYSTTTSAIPALHDKNPRILSAGNRNLSQIDYTTERHGTFFYALVLPANNNTLTQNIWGVHGSAVAGTAGSGTNGPEGRSKGVAPKAGLVLASDSADFQLCAGQVPEGNPFKTVALNRSFTGSSDMGPVIPRNSGLATVNAAGNSYDGTSIDRLFVYGISPHVASIRWHPELSWDFIASGLEGVTATDAFAASYGSQRNQESIFTDYSVSTLSPEGLMDVYWSGTSFASPFTVGGLTLVQQAYASTHADGWLRPDQMNRILKKSARFVDDESAGLRFPVADFSAAVELAVAYPGDPGFEPNFSTDFSDTNCVNNADNPDPHYLNPKQFRTALKYGPDATAYTAPFVSNGQMRVLGDTAAGEANVALRNGWGELAVVDLARPGKKVSLSFDYDTNPGIYIGSTKTYLGIKEMVGSAQFMNAERTDDYEPVGRLAFRITSYQGSDNCLVEALQCAEVPNTNNLVWDGPAPFTLANWSAPLASVVVTNLTLGHFPRIQVDFTAERMRFLRGGTELLNVAHTAPAIALTRATPYLHVKQAASDHLTRFDNFAVATVCTSSPVVGISVRRARALEAIENMSPVALGVLTVTREVDTNVALTVNYTLSGTASNGVDYVGLPGSVVIPANAAEADIVIRPLSDAGLEGPETATLQLAPGAGYAVGSADAATVAILDLTDADGDHVVNVNEDRNANGTPLDDDTDKDLLPNYVDPDDDGDHVGTLNEDRDGNGTPVDDDTDGDATPNYLDDDDDGDGAPTRQEDRNRNGNPMDDDYDYDGIPDYLDSDASWFSTYSHMALAGTFNGWSTTNEMALIGNDLWRAVVRLDNQSNVRFKFAANYSWYENWGGYLQTDLDLPISGTNAPYGDDILVNGTLNGTYLVTFNNAALTYSMQYVAPVDSDGDGMTDDWELLNGLLPSDPGDAGSDPDGDDFTNLEEFHNGTDPHVWNPRFSSYASLSVAATFNGWKSNANNMVLVDDYVWRYTGTFLNESNVQFKFAANGTWVTNWGENNQTDNLLPLTNGVAEANGGNIQIVDVLDGLVTFTFNESTRSYHVSQTCDEYCDLVSGIGQVWSSGAPGPLMGLSNNWKAIVGGDEDTSVPSTFAMAAKIGHGRGVALGHDGLVQNLNAYDNRAFMVNVMNWLNDGGGKSVAYSEGHAEWVKGPQLADLQAEMVSRGYAFGSIPGEITASSLVGRDVLIVGNAWQPFSYTELNAIDAFVNQGGSVLLLGLGWSWSASQSYPMNDLGERLKLRWLTDFIHDPTHQAGGSPIFRTFYPRVVHYDFEGATSYIAQVHAAYPTGLPGQLQDDARLRRKYLGAQSTLMAVGRDFYDYAGERWNLYQFIVGEMSNYPAYFSKNLTYDVSTNGVMANVRERFVRSLVDAYPYIYDSLLNDISTAGGFTGAYSNIWREFSVYLMDNNRLDSAQKNSISNYLGVVPRDLHNLRAISVNDFLGSTTPDLSLVGRPGQVNVFGFPVGTVTENPFPTDVGARTSEVFSIVVAHELNHVVDAYAINNNYNLKARKEALIAAAGPNALHYLRGGAGLEYLSNGFFTSNPQEFFASIANQWFTDSEQVMELGRVRFTNGIPHPMNQALFFADVYARGQNQTLFYKQSAAGTFGVQTQILARTSTGSIKVLSSAATTWFFGYDAVGGVTNVVKTNGTGDLDGDGMPDRWEMVNGFDPWEAADGAQDPDGDLLTSAQEYAGGTHPFRPDSDFDGISDKIDAQPNTPAYAQVVLPATALGTVERFSYHWVSYYQYTNYASWGTSYYSDPKGYARFDVTAIPDRAVIRHVAMTYRSQASTWSSWATSPASEIVGLGDLDLAATGSADVIYYGIASGAVLQATSTNEFPFGPRTDKVAAWNNAVRGDLASRLGTNVWNLGFRASGGFYGFSASMSNVAMIVSYETNGNYASAYDVMTLAGSLNGWNVGANNMLLVGNHLWRFVAELDRINGFEFKFAANRAWAVNWGDQDQAQFSPTLSGTAEASAGNVAVTGLITGTLTVTFNAQTGSYSVELVPPADSDADGMPDAWESTYGLNPGLNDAGLDPDGDDYSNLEEYQNRTDPNVWNPRQSAYAGLAVTGPFRDWSSATNMQLIADYTWRCDLPVTNLSGVQFKFVANDSWSTNWGENDQGQLELPLSGTAEVNGGNVLLNGTHDGTLRFTFYESTAHYSVELIPALDSDGDGMPDYWEDQYGLNKNLLGDAGLDPDADDFTNLQEYRRRTNPNVKDTLLSDHASLSVCGDFNGWNAGANNMKLVDNYVWRFAAGFDQPLGIAFKFTANGNWTTNWGDTNPPGIAAESVNGIAETNGPDIVIPGPLDGTYEFLFNENTREYRLARAAVSDFDQDGLPDDWEASHGFDARNSADAGTDADGDRLNNLQEYQYRTNPRAKDTDGDGFDDLGEVVAGTDAGNPASLLELQFAALPSGGVQFTWAGAAGRLYGIARNTNLLSSPWTDVAGHTNLLGHSGSMSVDLPVEVSDGYFQVKVQLAPSP